MNSFTAEQQTFRGFQHHRTPDGLETVWRTHQLKVEIIRTHISSKDSLFIPLFCRSKVITLLYLVQQRSIWSELCDYDE